jgi:hypothetical protein
VVVKKEAVAVAVLMIHPGASVMHVTCVQPFEACHFAVFGEVMNLAEWMTAVTVVTSDRFHSQASYT